MENGHARDEGASGNRRRLMRRAGDRLRRGAAYRGGPGEAPPKQWLDPAALPVGADRPRRFRCRQAPAARTYLSPGRAHRRPTDRDRDIEDDQTHCRSMAWRPVAACCSSAMSVAATYISSVIPQFLPAPARIHPHCHRSRPTSTLRLSPKDVGERGVRSWSASHLLCRGHPSPFPVRYESQAFLC